MATKEERQAKIEAMRNKMNAKLGGFKKDPSEFRPPVVEPGKSRNFYFHVLPPINDGDIFFVKNAAHWINNRTVQCPRVHESGDCPVCQLGFDLMEGVTDKKARSAIAKKYLPQQKYAVNILFTDDKTNGDLAGKVMWFNVPQSVFKKMQDALMRDNAGDDPRMPQAFGDFTDPDASFVFGLFITEKGGYNNYDTSNFLPGKPTPLQNIKDVLNNRHDLSSKFPEPDMKILQEYEKKCLSGDTDAGTDAGEVETKTEQKVEQKVEQKAEQKSEKIKTETQKKVEVSAPNDEDLEKLLNDLGVND